LLLLRNAQREPRRHRALRAAAIAGAGVAVLPAFMIHKEVLSGALVPLLLPYEKVPGRLFALFPSRKLILAKVRAFVDHLADQFAPCAYWDRDVFGVHEATR
jgi:DNA-binding transcriptional LysR family regulator